MTILDTSQIGEGVTEFVSKFDKERGGIQNRDKSRDVIYGRLAFMFKKLYCSNNSNNILIRLSFAMLDFLMNRYLLSKFRRRY